MIDLRLSMSWVKLWVFITLVLTSLALIFVAKKGLQEASNSDVGSITNPLWGLRNPYRDLLISNDVSIDPTVEDRLVDISRTYTTNNPLDPQGWIARSFLMAESDPAMSALYLKQAAMLSWNREVPLKKIYTEQLVRGYLEGSIQSAIRLITLKPNAAGQYFFDLYAILGSNEFYETVSLPAMQTLNNEQRSIVLTHFLEFAINAEDDPLISKIWDLFPEDVSTEDKRYLLLTKYLIDKQSWSRLKQVWQLASGRQVLVSRISDPEFNQVSEDSLCWTLKPVKGVTRTSNQNGIQLSFDGSRNFNYEQLRCVVGVEAGNVYRLKYSWAGDNISTRSGFFVQATTNLDSKYMVLGRSEARNGSWSLQSDGFEFTAPKGVSIITLVIRRSATDNLDNKLSGKIYLSGFKLDKL